ncbi:ThiF family adenylyltransferase [Chitinophaga vietnamensis]|uniref:ThiF family adenylyltransferase n=1 Tax=Chitinophaga vietnamensis TaxID=2593957 RepID=UPI0011784055|nr:ThiF family adenylyltransferase [Chitinophaga vietnamensis]
MNTTIANAILASTRDQYQRQVQFFRLNDPSQATALISLLEQHPDIKVFDRLLTQLAELVKLRHPSQLLTEEATQEHVAAILGNTAPEAYGVWVYYPWSGRIVHIVDEDEFIELRTSRNKQKITTADLQTLRSKKIGVMGLSVGQSVALTLAMERLCGELRIADFDHLDLSNMNRIRTGVQNIGILKTVLVAREIAEIDPFLKVVCYDEGISEENIGAFLTDNGKLDILVEECDSLDIKILSRHKARELGIPVLMDTSDRGMVDIERFDLQPDLPILHGRVPEHLTPADIRQMQGPARMAMVDSIVEFKALSAKMQQSLQEIGKSITTWPQLASAVMLGGAAIGHVCRELALGNSLPSGRYYVDLEQIFKQPN